MQMLYFRALFGDTANRKVLNVFSRTALLVLAIALLLRLLFALPVLLHPERSFVPGDSERYHRLAMNIAFRQRFSTDDEPYFLRPPTYPVFLALLYSPFGADAHVAVIAQVALSVVTAMLVGMLTRMLFGNGYMHAIILFAINPLSIAMCVVLMSETLFCALICGALIVFLQGCFWHPRNNGRNAIGWFVACGVLVGIAALCRSVAIGILPLLAALALFACRRCSIRLRAAQSLALVFAALLVITPWLFRNRVYLGRWLIDINGQVTLVFFASRVLSESHGISGRESDEMLLKLASKRFGWSYTSSDAANLHIFCEHHPVKAIQLSQVAQHIVLAEWVYSLHYYLRGCLLMWLPFVSYSTWVGTLYGKVPTDGIGGLSAEVLRRLLKLKFGEAFELAMRERFGRYPLVTLLWLLTLFVELCVYAFAIVGLLAIRRNAFTISLIIAVIIYFTLTGGIAGHFALSRLRMPIEPLLCAASGYGLHFLITRAMGASSDAARVE